MRLRFRDKSPSRLEAKFALYWRSLNGPELQREFVFHAERKWRANFAHVQSLTLIEYRDVGTSGIGHARA